MSLVGLKIDFYFMELMQLLSQVQEIGTDPNFRLQKYVSVSCKQFANSAEFF